MHIRKCMIYVKRRSVQSDDEHLDVGLPRRYRIQHIYFK